jgi:hypothetical protein
MQNKAVKCSHNRSDSNRETLAQRRKIARICAPFKAFTGGVWKDIGDRLQRLCSLNIVDHDRKIRNGKQRTNIRKYSIVNDLTALEPNTCKCFGTISCKPSNIRKMD